ncbi:CLUMA_CG018476, isoform A [Clunio marinus]|uniref:CLUMA_CG018476, isoform A n=1 Tax=Clunio marinus TaxID=568069 RepID=A0A1J1J3A3_9DIPT|nr:CLUMA_CG018476, isoform A [Clunio marinus]
MKSLTFLLFAAVIASGDAALRCEEVTDPCASIQANTASIYENANNAIKAIKDRCTFEAAASLTEEIAQRSSMRI